MTWPEEGPLAKENEESSLAYLNMQSGSSEAVLLVSALPGPVGDPRGFLGGFELPGFMPFLPWASARQGSTNGLSPREGLGAW